MLARKLILAMAIMVTAGAPAFADVATENYVRENANDVLESLNRSELSTADRRAGFQTYMDEFANIDAIARFTIGKYSRRFTPDEMDRYTKAFRRYALATYEFYFNEYKGREVEVTGSTDRNANDSIVDTLILRADGRKMEVRWRVLNRGGKYQVVDVALNAEGNLIWLAIEQQAQFISLLDKSNGSADQLIAKIDAMTSEVQAKAIALE